MAVQLFSMPKLCWRNSQQRQLPVTHKPLLVRSKSTLNSQPSDNRRSANYEPTTWGYDFVQSLKINPVTEFYEDRLITLEREVRGMINMNGSDADFLVILETIGDIERLGLRYRFEDDIKRALDIYSSWKRSGGVAVSGTSLHEAALSFRLLRQYGYTVSSDGFRNFMDQDGTFKTCLFQDVQGLLSLYKAAHLSFEGESLLDEAKAFAKIRLTELKEDMPETLSEEVNHGLELPLHYRMRRLEARWYIEACHKRQDKNHALLELAKLDFNMAQSELQTDLKDLSRWWKDTGLANKLTFARDRLMECFFWSIGMVSQPHLRNCRRGLTKVATFITIIDDIYDVYGSLDELELFTNAVESWDVNAVKNLPDYMKLCFLSLYNTVNEMAYDTLKEKGENAIPYLRKVWADMCKAFLQEAKWNHRRCRPTFKDYLETAWVSASGGVLLVHAYFLANQNIAKQALDSLENYHDLLRWPSVIFRLCNDLGTSSAELERGESINSISCYMSDTGNSEEVAREHLRRIIDEAWKKMNKVQFNNYPYEDPFTEIAKNLARISHCTYQYGDGHGAPDTKSKKRVLTLIIEPISF